VPCLSEIAADNALIWEYGKKLKAQKNETFLERVKAGDYRHTHLILESGVHVDCIDKSDDRKYTAVHHAVL
jgi:hypothetical protein